MMQPNDTSLLLVDVIAEFFGGSLGSPEARSIAPNISKLVDVFAGSVSPAIVVHDAHRKVDPEINVWGEHAMVGEESTKLIRSVDRSQVDFVLTKNTYSAFYETGLSAVLTSLDISSVMVAGVQTNGCCLHTTAGAFFRGFNTMVVEDACAATNEEDHSEALNYMSEHFGSDRYTTSEVVASFEEASYEGMSQKDV